MVKQNLGTSFSVTYNSKITFVDSYKGISIQSKEDDAIKRFPRWSTRLILLEGLVKLSQTAERI